MPHLARAPGLAYAWNRQAAFSVLSTRRKADPPNLIPLGFPAGFPNCSQPTHGRGALGVRLNGGSNAALENSVTHRWCGGGIDRRSVDCALVLHLFHGGTRALLNTPTSNSTP